MKRRIPKVYGEYRTTLCPFCGKDAHTTNKVKLPVCFAHKNTEYPQLKCMCGEWVDVAVGKFGSYCVCIRCGNVNLEKVLEVNGVIE